MKWRAVFFDRDGVINNMVERGDNFFVHGKKVARTAPFSYAEFRIKESVVEVLEKLGSLGFLRILISNQPDVTYGTLSRDDHARIMADVNKLPLDDFFLCMHGRNDGCACKKPKPGMLLEAAKKWNIDLPLSYMIGDSETDILTASAVGCKGIIIRTHYNQNVENDLSAETLLDAVSLIQHLENA